MLPDVQNLIALQQADREILRLKEEIAALPKRVAAIEERLAGTKAVLEKAKSAVKADEAARRKYETAIQDQQQKISKYRDQSLAVKTNEQYKALLHEIQFAEQDIRANEDKILELMVNAEIREKDVKAAEAKLKAETAEIEKEKVEARQRTAEDEKQLAEWNAKRDSAREPEWIPTCCANMTGWRSIAGPAFPKLAITNAWRARSCCDRRPTTKCARQLMWSSANLASGFFTTTRRMTRPDPVVVARRRRAHPKFESSQAWYYRPDLRGSRGSVRGLSSTTKGESSRHVYDGLSGRGVGDMLAA